VPGVANREERARSFGAIADDYDRLRPSPPEEAVGWLLPGRCELAVDVAAGTGLLSRMLASEARRVVAVEPDARMAAVLRARSAGVRVVQGTAESIPVGDARADGVFVSSAWHWMDPGRAIPEIARVLRDGGRFGVIWTSRDHEVDWLRELGRPRDPSPGRDPSRPREDGARRADGPRPEPGTARHSETPPRSWRRTATLPRDGLFGNIGTASFAFTRLMTVSGFVDMLATYSGVITASQDDRTAALASARDVLDQRFPSAEEIEVPMRAWCWRADRTPRAAR
jgi:SAM-dependent methyltransferase